MTAQHPRVSRSLLALAATVDAAIYAGQMTSQAEARQCLGLALARLPKLLALLQLAPDLQEQIFHGPLRRRRCADDQGLRCIPCPGR